MLQRRWPGCCSTGCSRAPGKDVLWTMGLASVLPRGREGVLLLLRRPDRSRVSSDPDRGLVCGMGAASGSLVPTDGPNGTGGVPKAGRGRRSSSRHETESPTVGSRSGALALGTRRPPTRATRPVRWKRCLLCKDCADSFSLRSWVTSAVGTWPPALPPTPPRTRAATSGRAETRHRNRAASSWDALARVVPSVSVSVAVGT